MKTSNKQQATSNFTKGFLILFSLFFATVSAAQNKVVVIPMAGDDLEPLANVITVAKQNGDFSSPVSAMNSIINASSTNPYLLVIAPGVYELGSQQLVMKEYVEIAGSGQNATFIRGSVSTNSADPLKINGAILIGANNSSIRDLTIENYNGSLGFQFGLYNQDSSPTVLNATISVTDAAGLGFAVSNAGNSSPTISNSNLIIESSGTSYGIFNSSTASTKTIVSNSFVKSEIPAQTAATSTTIFIGSVITDYSPFSLANTVCVSSVEEDGTLLDTDCDLL